MNLAAWIADAQAARLAQSDPMTLATASSPRGIRSAPSAALMPNTASRGLAGVSSKNGLRKPAALVTWARNCHAVVDWLAATAGG